MALASPFQHILHLLFKTFLTLSKGDVKKLKILLCGYSFPCPHIKICWNGGVQPFSLGMGIDRACIRSRRDVTALSTFWVDILPPWGTLSDRSVTEIAIASPSNETEHCLKPLLRILCVHLFTKDFDWNGLFACAHHIWIESAVYANVSLKGVHRGVGFALLWYFAVRSSALWKPLSMVMISEQWMINDVDFARSPQVLFHASNVESTIEIKYLSNEPYQGM